MILRLVLITLSIFIPGLVVLLMAVRFLSKRVPSIRRSESEKVYLDPKDSTKHSFPDMLSIDPDKDRASLYLSVIVPAYNEEKRLPVMLDEALEYLEKRSTEKSSQTMIDLPVGEQFSYEIIIVDDGSKDDTTKVGLDYCLRYGCDKVRVLTLEKNRGKGGAVRLGMLASRGKLLLLADADGATLFKDIENLESFLHQSCKTEDEILHGIAIGSRKHLEEEAKAKRSLFRTILMIGFHFLVWFFTVRTVRDTQCGFKLFGRKIARVLFTAIHVERWAFDVELLYLAEQLQCKLGEISVNWTEIEGSKIIPVFSWLQMGKDVLIVAFMYATGSWSVPDYQK